MAAAPRPARFRLLRANAAFRNIWLARTISFLGDTVVLIALVIYVYDLKKSGVYVAALLLAQTLPRLLGPFAGTLADRLDHRRVMMICDIGQAAIFAAIAITRPPFPLLLPLVFVAGVLATIFTPSGRSTVPTLVERDELPMANALLATGLYATMAIGPAVGGVLVAGVGTRTAIALNAASFVFSAFFVSRLPAARDEERVRAASSFLSETRAGIGFVIRNRTALAVCVGLFLTVVFAGLDNVAGVFLAKSVFNEGSAGYGIFASGYGVGMVIAPLVLLRLIGRFSASAVLLAGMALLAVGNLVTGLAPVFAIAVTAQAVAGAGNGLENVGNDTLIQQDIPSELMGRVFGTVYTAAFLGEAIAYGAGGLLLTVVSARTLFVIAGLGLLLSLVFVRAILGQRVATPFEAATGK
jgi:MFS family permease